MYGNYDGLNQVPQFDLLLGPNLWGTVTLQNNASAAITMDIFMSYKQIICMFV